MDWETEKESDQEERAQSEKKGLDKDFEIGSDHFKDFPDWEMSK